MLSAAILKHTTSSGNGNAAWLRRQATQPDCAFKLRSLNILVINSVLLRSLVTKPRKLATQKILLRSPATQSCHETEFSNVV